MWRHALPCNGVRRTLSGNFLACTKESQRDSYDCPVEGESLRIVVKKEASEEPGGDSASEEITASLCAGHL